MKHEVSRWRRGTAQMESESDSTQIAIMWPLLKTIKYSTAIGHHASVISRSHTFFDSHAICRNYILSETKITSG